MSAQPRDSTPSDPDCPDRDGSRDRGRAHPAGAILGRYVILDHVASGGMGEVYTAHDPTLDRRVALKLLSLDPLTSRARSRHRDRLLREAKALAQLSHPNVVTVHDVGTVRGQAFVAMELISGQSAKQWLRDKPRSRGDILRVFAAAGRGLAAAHRAGLIHRDIKPSNIMIGDDGRVRVVDFGLARSASDDLDSPSNDSIAEASAEDQPSRAPRSFEAPLTAVGTVVGTPSYMAPEQGLGGSIDARADQFSFCVSLVEALGGERLRSKPGVLERRDIDAALSGLPRRLRRVLKVGLAAEPANRYETMDALLVDLERAVRVVRWTAGTAAAVVAVVAVGGLSLAQRGALAERCRLGADETRALWSPAWERAIGDTLAEASRAHGVETAARVSAILRDRADAWAAMRKESCEATWVQETQSAELLDLRSECLRERKAEQVSLLALLTDAPIEAVVVDRAVEAATGLPAIARCSDAEALRSTSVPEPGAADEVAKLRDRLAAVRVRRLAGDYRRAANEAKTLVDRASDLGFTRLLGEASCEHGIALLGAASYPEAKAAFEQAVESAGVAGDSRTAALAAGRLLWVVGYGLDRAHEALLSEPMARALAAQVPNDPEVQVTLQMNVGTAKIAAGRYAEAQAEYRRGFELAAAAWGRKDLRVVKAQTGMGIAAHHLGDQEAAAAAFENGVELMRGALGAGHPELGRALNNLGVAQVVLGRHGESLASCRESLRIFEQVYGAGHVGVVPALNCMVRAHTGLGDTQEAVRLGERSLGICDSHLSPNNVRVGNTAFPLAAAYLEQGNNEAALGMYRRAVAAFEPDHPYLVWPLLGSAKALSALGRDSEARQAASRAVAVASERGLPELADAHAELARILFRAGDHEQARAEATQALDAFAAAGEQGKHDELAAWLANGPANGETSMSSDAAP